MFAEIGLQVEAAELADGTQGACAQQRIFRADRGAQRFPRIDAVHYAAGNARVKLQHGFRPEKALCQRLDLGFLQPPERRDEPAA